MRRIVGDAVRAPLGAKGAEGERARAPPARAKCERIAAARIAQEEREQRYGPPPPSVRALEEALDQRFVSVAERAGPRLMDK